MNLSTIKIAPTCEEMIHDLNTYYNNFHREIIRMGNLSINSFLEDYMKMLQNLILRAHPQDMMRAAIGVLSLHRLGFREFDQITKIFDKLIPQKDEECAKFTSYIAGQLVHHPEIHQTQYVSHLFKRLVGWITVTGRRQRLLAASFLLCSLTENAGNSIILFIPTIQTTIWHLISLPFPKLIILKTTARSIALTTRSILRYARKQLDSYLSFLDELCTRLLNFGNVLKSCAGLLFFTEMIRNCPDYFIKDFSKISNLIIQTQSLDNPTLDLKLSAFSCAVALAEADPKQFIDYFFDSIFDRAQEILLSFPIETVNGLCSLCNSIPDLIEENIDMVIQMLESLIRIKAFDALFKLLISGLKLLPNKFMNCYDKNFDFLLSAPITKALQVFLVDISHIPDTFDQSKKQKLMKLLEDKLLDYPEITLKIIAGLNPEVFVEPEGLFKMITGQTNHLNFRVRKTAPLALFNLHKAISSLSTLDLIAKFYACATIERNVDVRESYLKVINDNCSKEFASSRFLHYYQVLLNDDSNKVRTIVLHILSKLAKFNPIAVTAITRNLLDDTFHIMQKVQSIRQQAHAIGILPHLVEASLNIVQSYSPSLIFTLETVLSSEYSQRNYLNFIEENAVTEIQIGVINSLATIAQHDQETISKNATAIIRLLCQHLNTQNSRHLVLSILQTLQIMLSPEASTTEIRTQSTEILAACTSLLAQTQSRKTRIEILKVVGTIGVIDVHHKPHQKLYESPQNIDDSLARKFFHPFRDAEGTIDDSMLLNSDKVEQYYISVVSRSLLEIFEDESQHDLFYDVACALENVLKNPKMTSLVFFDRFMNRLLEIIEQSQVEQKKEFITILANLIRSSSNNVSPFVTRTIELVKPHFFDELTLYSLDLIIALLEALGNGFLPYTVNTITSLTSCLDNAKTNKKEVSQKVLHIFGLLGQFALDFRYLIVQQVCDAVVCEQTLNDVRSMSLQTLCKLIDKVDLYEYLGPIRALKYGLTCKANRNEAKKLAYHLVIKFDPRPFYFDNNEIPELSLSPTEAVAEMEKMKPIRNNQTTKKQHENVYTFSRESVIARAVTPNLGLVRHLESWMNSLMLTVISNSPSSVIRACQTVANSCPTLAKKLLNPAFYSCWNKMDKSGRDIVARSFSELLLAQDRYDSVARDVLNILVFMDKIESPIEITPRDVITASIRYGCYTYALKLLERIENPTKDDVINMIDVYLQLGNWFSAYAVYQKYLQDYKSSEIDDTSLFRKLHKWDKSASLFKQQNQQGDNSPETLAGLLESLSNLSQWNEVMSFLPTFEKQKKHHKQQISTYLAEAAIHIGKWDDLDKILPYSPIGSIEGSMMNALNSLHKKDWGTMQQSVDHGFSLLASQPIMFWEDEQKIHHNIMLLSQQFIEIQEMQKWLLNENRDQIETVWNSRLKTAPRDFELWLSILSNRLTITQKKDKSLINFFQLKSISLGTKLHTNAFEHIFKDFDFETSPDLDRLCYVIAKWNIGEKQEALDRMEELTKSISSDYQMHANYFYAIWLLESDDTLTMLNKAYALLDKISKMPPKRNTISAFRSLASINSLPIDSHITRNGSQFLMKMQYQPTKKGIAFSNRIMKNLNSDIDRVNVLRKWASVNTALIPFFPTNSTLYVNQAMEALDDCIKLYPEFPDIAQLLNLFFEHACKTSIFQNTNRYIQNLPPGLLLQVFPQILIQISHPSPEIANFVHNLILKLLKEHYHSIIFSIQVQIQGKIQSRANRAKQILQDFATKQVEIPKEVDLIRTALYNAAVTCFERARTRLEEFIDKFGKERNPTTINQCIFELESLLYDKDTNRECVMYQQFYQEFKKDLENIETLIEQLKSKPEKIVYKDVEQMVNEIIAKLAFRSEGVKMIQLRSVSKELCNKTNFHIAVPGTYKPDKPLIRIQYFVGQFGVYQSKQQPKVVCIKGDDGNFYQYLLKGHEDLRLDERLMQFFKLINSLVKKQTSNNSSLIQTMSITPLSLYHGLVQWVKGTDTMKYIVDHIRNLHQYDTETEFYLQQKYGIKSVDNLLPIQAYLTNLKIFNEVPDTDIANFLWLKAANADIWMKQTTTFAISNGVMSIVGYIIGLGDRHPSNLLIDRYTGKVVHIDFGDSFELAATRSYKPEVVPFRLTRMMVRAMGLTGVDGPFRNAFINMSQLLRDNRRVLLMVLAIFVHEPLVDPEKLTEQDLATPETQQPEIINIKEQQHKVVIKPNGLPDVQIKQTSSADLPSVGMKRSQSVSANKKMSNINLFRSGSKTIFEPSLKLDEVDEQTVSNSEKQERVKMKLLGKDFDPSQSLTVEEQADLLIKKATDMYLLSKMYSGWFPYW